ncbi:DUF1993 family protein [Rhodoligotrophos ferricapiens]|uniref:DUF1993 family protein n=1 Tax=Rhodoligotrophos ferricapiens TaxID=3069264 RepID=UPI00315DF6C3
MTFGYGIDAVDRTPTLREGLTRRVGKGRVHDLRPLQGVIVTIRLRHGLQAYYRFTHGLSCEVAMSFSVYEITVPAMLHGLRVHDDYLDHAQRLERSRGLAPGEVLQAALAPDMLSFGKQSSISCNKVEAHMSKLMQRDLPAPVEPAMTYPALKGRLLETRGFLQAIEPNMLNSAQTHTYDIKPTIAHGWYGGDDYIRHLVIPDFFFHVAIAHAILRHLGAQVGKRDYLGNLSQQSGGYS